GDKAPALWFFADLAGSDETKKHVHALRDRGNAVFVVDDSLLSEGALATLPLDWTAGIARQASIRVWQMTRGTEAAPLENVLEAAPVLHLNALTLHRMNLQVPLGLRLRLEVRHVEKDPKEKELTPTKALAMAQGYDPDLAAAQLYTLASMED